MLIHKLSYQTFSEICDHVKNHNFSIQDMDSMLQYIIGKLEHANLVLGDKTNVESVGAHSQQDQNRRGSYKCPFCSDNHKAVDCTNYKTIQARKNRVISQRLCFNCLTPGHPSKNCRRKRRAASPTYTIILLFAIKVNLIKVSGILHNPLKITSPLALVVGTNNNNNNTHNHTRNNHRITNNPWLHNTNQTLRNNMLLLLQHMLM